MPHKKIILEWLDKAEEDFGFASANLADTTNNYFSQICFHFQQAAEKYLKTYIVAKELKFRKMHDLDELRLICLEKSKIFESIERECIVLTDYYVDTRYPAVWPLSFTREKAEEAKIMAKKIGDLVKKLLQDEALS